MEINQSLENALKLADLDFNGIKYKIDVEFYGSLDAYFDYVRQLSTDFETALALMVLNSNPVQITNFASLNLTKIHISIRQIKFFDELCSRSRIKIDSDPVNSEIIDGYFRPIHNAHLSQLVYIEKLLKDVLKNINGNIPVADIKSEPECKSEVLPLSAEIDILSDYPDLLSMNDMKAIFKVERNAICTYEKKGHFKRCSAKYQTILFKKEDIKRYLLSRE